MGYSPEKFEMMFRALCARLDKQDIIKSLDFLTFGRLAYASCIDTESLGDYKETQQRLKQLAGLEQAPTPKAAVSGLAGRLKLMGAKESRHNANRESS